MTKLILIDITEKENTLLDDKQEIKEITGSGTLLVKNTSQKSRLWNMRGDVKENVNTSLQKGLDIGLINPGEEYSNEYNVEELKQPTLKVKETFDTARNILDRVNKAFLYNNNNECKLKIELTNPLETAISNIIVQREIPAIFQNLELSKPTVGEASLIEEGGKTLNWKIDSLGGNQTAQLTLLCNAMVNKREDQKLGELQVNYLIEGYQRTMIDPAVEGLTDSLSGVTRDEGATPGTWDCNVEFINESEFQVRLEDVQVSHKITTGEETVVSEQPKKELNPDDFWDHDFQVESPNVPQLETKIEFTPLFTVEKRVIGEIKKETTFYPVLSAEIEKIITPPEVDAYANTNMEIKNVIPNLGTANIDSIEILDKLPKDFIPPELKEITLVIENSEGNVKVHERDELINKMSIDPEDQNPDKSHDILIKLDDLAKYFLPNSKLIMTYDILAKNPKPEVKYDTPVEIRANTVIPGKFFVISPPEEPIIKIKYVKRKLKTLKSIRPGMSAGEFDITIRVQNKGDVELENIEVIDKIPTGFKLTECQETEGMSYEVKAVNEESEIVFSMDELEGKDSVSIKFTCSGEGDYPRTEPIVVVKGRSAGSDAKDATEAELTTGPSVSTVSQKKEGELHQLFLNIDKKINRGINAKELGEFLEGLRDDLPPGPVLHQFMRFARELKDQGDKMVIGSFEDEVRVKINNFKSKYS